MSRLSTIIVICLLIIIILAVSNPNQDNFIDWVIEQEDASTELEALLDEVIGRTLLQATTDRKNYIIFSVFTIREEGEDIKYIGILRRIFFRR